MNQIIEAPDDCFTIRPTLASRNPMRYRMIPLLDGYVGLLNSTRKATIILFILSLSFLFFLSFLGLATAPMFLMPASPWRFRATRIRKHDWLHAGRVRI
ncbi:uncharacterized protein BDZ99DRAFT_38076 [Mytilinidion resinicola]|uniref:Uncharacterized protein n=1 Tax=Mytilinidion resinicola TaxID=574789 RepID=A0A6A6YJI1_9PEZI|nr:uncharacterized protein BDZ99DRAFT_38076 [Mytilinidion resinicola]KAF2808708.1 hypothetical protein BDZ99DRAFT_38076 [Mytilinidion resinicola]